MTTQTTPKYDVNEKGEITSVTINNPGPFPQTAIPNDIKQMASEIITGLLREEGWELPETNDEERTTSRLEHRLLDVVNKLLAARMG